MGRLVNVDLNAPGLHFSFGAPSGVSTPAGTTGMLDTLVPNTDTTFTNLTVQLSSAAPVGSNGVTVGLGDDASYQLSCLIPEGSTTCNTGSGTYAAPAGGHLQFVVQPGAPVAGTTDVMFGYQAVQTPPAAAAVLAPASHGGQFFR